MGPSLFLETFRAIGAWQARRLTEARLADLDDHMLRDVGIERHEIPLVAERCSAEARHRASHGILSERQRISLRRTA